MPHINRIRFVNIAFNENLQVLDDFDMSFLGYSSTYQLENGGGKSVMLMMLLQTVLPKTSLKRDHPLGNIFIGGKDRTSHVLVEWALDEGERYKYLLTGFCARKKRSGSSVEGEANDTTDDENLLNSEVDAFNYYHLYNEPNAYDIKNLGLVSTEDGKSKVMSFNGLKKYIKELKGKGKMIDDFTLQRDYINFIRGYGLIDTEWRIIREINGGENNIASYFRQNNTSRKIIENLLIKVVEDIESKNTLNSLGAGDDSKNLAETLMEIREKIKEYIEKKDLKNEYEYLFKLYEKFKEKALELKDSYSNIDSLHEKIIGVFNNLDHLIKELQDEKGTGESLLIEIDNNIEKIKKELVLLNIRRLEIEEEILTSEKDNENAKVLELESEETRAKESLDFAEAKNEYLDYKKENQELLENEKKIEMAKKSNKSLYAQRDLYGYNLKVLLEKSIDNYNNQIKETVKLVEKLEESRKLVNKEKEEIMKTSSSLWAAIKQLKEERDELKDIIKECDEYFRQRGSQDLLLFTEESIEKLRTNLNDTEKLLNETSTHKDTLKTTISKVNYDLGILNTEIKNQRENLKKLEEFFSDYSKDKSKIDKISEFYSVNNNLFLLKQRLNELLISIKGRIAEIEIEKKKRLNEINRLSKDYFVINEDIETVKKVLEKQYKNVFLGIEILHKNKSEEEKNILLEKNPFIPYSVILSNSDFEKLQNNRDSLIIDVTSPVPVLNLDSIRNIHDIKTTSMDNVLFTRGDSDFFLSKEKREVLINNKEEILNRLKEEEMGLFENVETIDDYNIQISLFENNFSPEKVSSKTEEKNNLLLLIDEKTKKLNILLEKKEDLDKEKIDIEEKEVVLLNSFKDLKDDLIYTEKRVDTYNKLEGVLKTISEKESLLEKSNQKKIDIDNKLESIESDIFKNKDILLKLKFDLETINNQYNNLGSYSVSEILNEPLEKIQAKLKAINEKLEGKIEEVNSLENICNKNKKNMKRSKKIINEKGKSIECFKKLEDGGTYLAKESDDEIDRIKKMINEIEKRKEQVLEAINKINNKISEIGGQIKTKYEDSNLDKEIVNLFIDLKTFKEVDNVVLEKNTNEGKLNQDKGTLKLELEKIDETLKEYLGEHNKISAMIKEKSITYDKNVVLEEIIGYEALSSNYETIVSKINKNRYEFEKYKKDAERDSKTSDFKLIEPIERIKDMKFPKDLSQASSLVEEFEMQIDIVFQQVSSIETTLMHLEGYQDDFANRCKEKAQWILSKLKRFNSLTRITLNGEKINMAEIRFKDFSEEEQNARIKNYIDKIIREIDETENITKLQISKMLESKELLAQITDMEKISLHLYKVEDDRESSRHLRWSRAIGSDGQSNAIYLIFAICLISFIRATTMTSNIDSKKVVIADNPFGTTGASYLWNPIFKIIKENNVQLITPGFQIPRELLSNFGVNYMLQKGKGSEGRESIIIEDIRTEANLDLMKYEIIETEQQTFF